MFFKELRFSAAFCFSMIHGILIFLYAENWKINDFIVGTSAAFITGATFDLLAFGLKRFKFSRYTIYFLAMISISLTALHIIYNEAQLHCK